MRRFQLTATFASDAPTLFDVTHEEYLELVDERTRKQHLADRLVQHTVHQIISYYWQREIRQLLAGGWENLTLARLQAINLEYEDSRLRGCDENMRVYMYDFRCIYVTLYALFSTRIHDSTLR